MNASARSKVGEAAWDLTESAFLLLCMILATILLAVSNPRLSGQAVAKAIRSGIGYVKQQTPAVKAKIVRSVRIACTGEDQPMLPSQKAFWVLVTIVLAVASAWVVSNARAEDRATMRRIERSWTHGR